MKFRIKLFWYLTIILIIVFSPFVFAQENTNANLTALINNLYQDNGINFNMRFASYSMPIELSGRNLVITNNKKILILDLQSFIDSKDNMKGISSDYNPDTIYIQIKNDSPEIEFRKGNITIISIKQIEVGTTTIYYGIPDPDILQSKTPFIYLVEHYDPEKKYDDPTRIEGTPRFTVISNNNPGTEIENNGILVRTQELKINTKSLLAKKQIDNRELDSLSGNLVSEIFGNRETLIIRNSEFTFDNLFDRSFSVSGQATQPQLDFNLDGYYDVTPGNCSKLGFVFVPGFGYNFINETNKFTNTNGWALGIAYSKGDNYQAAISDMTDFIEKSDSSGLVPIVRILGENWQENLSTPESVASFIKTLKQATGTKLKYVQIWDKPNVIFNNNDVFRNPIDYANYVINIKNLVNDPDIKFISASLSLGISGYVGENLRRDSDYYLTGLLSIPKFWNAIDYWGSSAYSLNESGNGCINGTLQYIGEQLCPYTILGYKWELQKIDTVTGKGYQTILTEVGYPTDDSNHEKTVELLNEIKADPNVISADIFLANGWANWKSSTWTDEENKSLSSFAERVSQQVCR